MHRESLEGMSRLLETYANPGQVILDIGSMEVKRKGSYRDVLPEGVKYVGLDFREGKNVDIVSKEYNFPLPDNSYDLVISGQCFEHVRNPFKLFPECARVLKFEGYFIGVAPFVWKEHRHPVDCWRFLPDGWAALFEESGLEFIDSYITKNYGETADCWGIAKKCL